MGHTLVLKGYSAPSTRPVFRRGGQRRPRGAVAIGRFAPVAAGLLSPSSDPDPHWSRLFDCAHPRRRIRGSGDLRLWDARPVLEKHGVSLNTLARNAGRARGLRGHGLGPLGPAVAEVRDVGWKEHRPVPLQEQS